MCENNSYFLKEKQWTREHNNKVYLIYLTEIQNLLSFIKLLQSVAKNIMCDDDIEKHYAIAQEVER